MYSAHTTHIIGKDTSTQQTLMMKGGIDSDEHLFDG